MNLQPSDFPHLRSFPSSSSSSRLSRTRATTRTNAHPTSGPVWSAGKRHVEASFFNSPFWADSFGGQGIQACCTLGGGPARVVEELAVMRFAHVITGFRNHELREYLQRRFGLSPDDYTAAQLRYDLLKLRAKGWIRKLDGQTRYVLTPKVVIHATALARLNECLNGTLGHPCLTRETVSSPQPELQKHYRRVRSALDKLLTALGLAA